MINSRIIICMQDEVLYKKMKRYSKKYIFLNVRWIFRKIAILLTNSALVAVEWYIAYQGKGVDVLYKKKIRERLGVPFIIICLYLLEL